MYHKISLQKCFNQLTWPLHYHWFSIAYDSKQGRMRERCQLQYLLKQECNKSYFGFSAFGDFEVHRLNKKIVPHQVFNSRLLNGTIPTSSTMESHVHSNQSDKCLVGITCQLVLKHLSNHVTIWTPTPLVGSQSKNSIWKSTFGLHLSLDSFRWFQNI